MPDPPTTTYDDEFVQRFDAFVRNAGIEADILLVAGDLSEYARPDELELAAGVVERLAKSLGVSADDVVFCPGNHDKDWLPMKHDAGDRSGFRRRQQYAPLRHPEWLFGRLLEDKVELIEDPFFTSWDTEHLYVLAFNSAWNDSPDDKIHQGEITEQQLAAIEAYVPDLRRDSRFAVLLTHHHPIQYVDGIPVHDLSIMQNGQGLIDLAGRCGFDLIVHGHKHVPRFQVVRAETGNTFGVLCAGSFSRELDVGLAGRQLNVFHLVEFTGRDITTKSAVGSVVTWSYIFGQGWTESRRDNAGIGHRLPFGNYILPEELATDLSGHLEASMDSRTHIKWSELCGIDARWEHVPLDVVHHVLENLAKEFGLELHPEPYGNPMLLRR